MQDELEDYRLLKLLRAAKSDSLNKKRAAPLLRRPVNWGCLIEPDAPALR